MQILQLPWSVIITLQPEIMPYYINNYDQKISDVHGNFKSKIKAYAALYNNQPATISDYVSAITDIQNIINVAKVHSREIRAHGSRWSLNNIFHSKDINVVNSNPLRKKDKELYQDPDSNVEGQAAPINNNFNHFLTTSELLDKTAGSHDYFFCQSGLKIGELNKICESENRSLMTSGASNGQSIAGAISTGVHGSSHHIGSIQDTIRGIHLITGTNNKDSVYVEPASAPMVEKSFLDSIGVNRHIKDDDLFYSCLVGLGTMGYIHGVLMETVPLYYLQSYARKVNMDTVYKFFDAIRVDPTAPEKVIIKEDIIPIENESLNDLYHMKFYINQYNERVVAEMCYKHLPFRGERRTPTFFENNKEVIITVGKFFSTILPFAIPLFINKQMPKDPKDEDRRQTLGDTFNLSPNIRLGQYALAVSFPIEEATEALQLLMKEVKKSKKFPNIFSLRFVKRSKAKMAFTRFGINCIFGIDGMNHKRTRAFERRIAALLIEKKISHTWHWGKSNSLTPEFIKDVYDADLVTWQKARTVLIKDEQIRNAFTNEYTRKRGLV